MKIDIKITKKPLNIEARNELLKSLKMIGYDYPYVLINSVFKLDRPYMFSGKYGSIEFTIDEKDLETSGG